MEFQELLAWSIVVFCSLCFYVYYTLWLGPEKIRRELMKQGIGGPAPTFFYGNVKDMKRMSVIKKVGMEEKQFSHEFTLFPYFNLWRNEYGMHFCLFDFFFNPPCYHAQWLGAYRITPQRFTCPARTGKIEI